MRQSIGDHKNDAEQGGTRERVGKMRKTKGFSYRSAGEIDSISGCMIGGALGDSLGYPVEFLDYDEILQKYGENGICNHKLDDTGIAIVSDDTQMTMYTANGLLNGAYAYSLGITTKPRWASYVHEAYKEWCKTQISGMCGSLQLSRACWITENERLLVSRTPGSTCMHALRSDYRGSTLVPLNNSKGCGGLMRIAPVGLYLRKFVTSSGASRIDSAEGEIFQIGMEIAALTHGNPLGFIPAGIMALIIDSIVYLGMDVRDAVEHSMQVAEKHSKHDDTASILEMVSDAIELSQSGLEDVTAISKLGHGWTADEALAIAVYCSLKHSDSFMDAIVSAVNHSGDSDSTGAIVGNIVGANIGLGRIPGDSIDVIEFKDELLQLSYDMFTSHNGLCPSRYDRAWQRMTLKNY